MHFVRLDPSINKPVPQINGYFHFEKSIHAIQEYSAKGYSW